MHLDRLGTWLTDPAAAARTIVDADPAGPVAAVAELAWQSLGPELAGLLGEAGLPAVWRPADPATGTPATLWLFTSADLFGPGLANPPAWVVVALENLAGTLAVHLVPGGTWSMTATAGSWTITVTGGVTLTAKQVTVTADANLTAAVASTTVPAVVVGPADGPHLQIGTVGLGVTADLHDGQPPELKLALDIAGLAVSLGPGGSDSFIGRILSQVGAANLTLGLRWSPQRGLQVSGGLDRFSILLLARAGLGPVEVRQLTLATTLGADATSLALTGEITASLGPLFCRVEGLGLQLQITGDAGALGVAGLRTGLKPPTGIGLRVAAGPVSGGGYLFFDHDRGEYAGVLELAFAILNLKAIGLLTTRLPDGRPGFSLLIIITAEFSPIQLGFGFALTGVGGLLGINRTMNVDALRDGVRTRVLDSILFPVDPVRNAPQVIANVRRVFPPAEDRYTFGPMVRIAWGPTSIIQIAAAVILELPAPLRLAILGRLSLVLPDRRAPIVALWLQIAGILDFDRGEVSVDASLFDSRIAAFPIAGDMAFRMGWKASKMLAISAGGFHPRFPVPAGFPVMRPLSISLCDGDNPRLRVSAYFALTSTSVQFGGGLDLYAGLDTFLGTFSVTARATIDALIGEPFGFLLDLSIAVDICLDDVPLLHAALKVSLQGTAPWRAYGTAEIAILFFKAEIGFDVTFGQPAELVRDLVALWPVLAAALGSDDAWAAQRPTTGAMDVTLGPSAGDDLLVHPLGRFTVRQRTLPLGTAITRFGTGVPAGNDTRFEIVAMQVGSTVSTGPAGLRDDFAIAQFVDLTDDQRLSRPAFEPLPAGAQGTVPGYRLPVADSSRQVIGVDAEPVYDDAIIDVTDTGKQRRPRPPGTAPATPERALAGLLDAGAAGRAATRAVGDPRAGGPDRRAGIIAEGWVEVPYDHLPANDTGAAARASTYTEAAEHRGAGLQLVTVAEVSR